ncbi:MAG: FAD-dependent oxidoreductase [Candidatus Paceibacterota bacterium]
MTQQTKLLDKKEVAVETLELRLQRPAEFSYKSGQHIDLGIEQMSESDDLGSVRTFSLVSAPHEDELVVATRLRDTAFKRELKKREVGADNLSIDGPFGNMTLHSRSERPAVMLAGGIGITPFVSLVRHMVHDDLPHRSTVLYSNHTAADAAYLEELTQIAAENERIDLVPTFTREGGSRIDEAMIRGQVADIPQAIWYLAGPPPFVKAMQTVLETLGVEDDDVRFEEFAGY